jgi:phosphoribosylglycinamide formyltransferase 1
VSRLRVGVLVSGRGSNLGALVQAANDPAYPARIVLVCANRECPALDVAKRAGLAHQIFRQAAYPDRKARDQAMSRALHSHDAELVVCAGYDAILEGVFTRTFAGRIINVHPSLLPDFAGTMDAVAMALEAGVAETGCTIHVVTDDVDHGPILAQHRVAVRPDDTVDSLRARIQAEEHILLPAVVKQLAGQLLPISM